MATDIDDFRLDKETDTYLAAAAAKNKKSEKTGKTKKRREPFIIITKTQFDMLGSVANSTTLVLLHLMFRDFAARGKPFKLLSDGLSDIGVDRQAKQRAIDNLEKLGWISVERNPGKEPVITLTRPAKAAE
jgi:DNA-binding MarR family transcriptional regulator